MQFLILIPVLIYFLFGNKIKAMLSHTEQKQFLKHLVLRGCDAGGCGHFGASRGNRTHKGLDVLINPDAPVLAPFNCVIKRIGQVYTDTTKYKLIEVLGVGEFKGYTMKIMYAETTHEPSGKVFKQGEIIGKAQNISERYSSVQNHLHLEMYNVSNTLINPEIYV